MFDVAKYLQRIGVEGTAPAPTSDTLRLLHRRHLLSVPYDNSTAPDRLPDSRQLGDVPLDVVYEHVVDGANGGVCYENNRLLHRLLTELGYDVRMIAAAVRQANGEFGPEQEHTFNLAFLDGRTYLVDVGFPGPSFLEPLLLSPEEQVQQGCTYRVVERDGCQVVDRRPAESDWQPVFRFRPELADPDGWEKARLDSLDEYTQDSVLAGTVFRSRSTANGKLVLIGRRLFTVEDGVERIKVLVKADDLQNSIDLILAGE